MLSRYKDKQIVLRDITFCSEKFMRQEYTGTCGRKQRILMLKLMIYDNYELYYK
jgi:hypothetical protein